MRKHNISNERAAGQAMLAMSDTGALLRFVQRPNAASLAEGRAALQAAGRYSELVELYQRRGQHQAALSLLRALSQARGVPGRREVTAWKRKRGAAACRPCWACVF